MFFLLSACNTADDTSTAPTTGQESAFQLTGDVSAVDVEDVDVDVDVSAGPDGIDIDPSGSVTVQLTVNLESINDEAAQLCGLQAGRDATVVVTDETDLDVDRPLAELGTIQDESITASGTARQLVGSDASANEPAGNCTLAAASLALAEEPAAEGSPTPVA
ncbi:MAG TPA: hypothetical protein VHJ78_03735 [Actinomycetota bacterium]|nr:hypothetical protein [Actinomycetota bacterium]